MQQDNSLNMSMQELINIEKEQIRILNEMNGRDLARNTQSMMSQDIEHSRIQQSASAQFAPNHSNAQNTNMYMYASNNIQNRVGPNINFEPPILAYDAQTGQMRKQQFNEYANSVVGNANNYGFVSSVLPQNSRVSNEARTLTAMDAGYRVSQAGVAALGALGTAGSTWALGGAMTGGGVAGFLGSMALTGGVGAALGIYTDIALDEIKQQSAYRKYLTQNSYMFISPSESVNNRGIAGFSQNQTKQAANFLRGLSSDTFLKDEEVMMLTQKFTEGGLLRDSKDLESFKKQMTSLTKSVKTGALILNETYESIADVLAEFKKLGLDQKDFNQTLSGIKVNAANLGIDAGQLTQQVVSYLTNLNYGTGNSNSHTYSRLEDTTLYTSNLYQELSDIPEYKRTQQQKAAYNMIKNLGGTDKSAEYLNTMQEKILDNSLMKNQIAGYFFDYDTEKKNWSLNQGKFQDFLTSDKTFGEIANVISAKFATLNEQGHGAAVTEFMANAGTYMRNSMTDGDVAKTIQGTINSLLRDESYGGNGYDTTKILSDIFEIKDSGAQNLLGTYLDYRIGKGDDLGYAFNQQKKWTEIVNSTKAQTPSIGEWFSSKWDSFKKSSTQLSSTIGDWFSDASVAVSDWWYRTRNGVSAPKLSENFEIKSLSYGSSSTGVFLDQKDALKQIGSVSESLNRLKEKGYTLDEEISKLAENAMDSFSKTVVKTRERIYNWGHVDEGVAARKDDIISASSNTGLSEVILSALVKYDQTNNTGKVTGEALKTVAESLSRAVNKYQGNETLGLLSSYAGVDVDNLLKSQFGININNLSKEDVEKLQNLKIDDIELSDETKQLIKQLLNVDLSKNGTTSTGETTTTTTGGYAVDYSVAGTTRKNEELIKLASDKYGFSEATFAALLVTENESGENHSVNGAGARGAAQLTSSVTGWAGQVQDLVTGETWDGNMATVTGEQHNSMNISVGAAHFNSYLEKAKGNAFIGYGMYNGGPTGFGNILRSAGYNEDQWANMTGDQIMNILNTYKPGTEYQAAMKRFINQLERVTGDENISSISGAEVNSKGATTTVQVDSNGNEYVINNGIRTYTETTVVDTTLSEEENKKLREIQQGIVTSSTGKARFDFLSQVQGVLNAKDADYESMINDLVKQDKKAGGYAEYVKNLINKGYSYDEIKDREGYTLQRNLAIKNGGEDIVQILDEIDSVINAWSRFGGSGYDPNKKYESDELRNGAKERFENADKYKSQYILEKYGESVGIKASDFNGDLAKYNAAINETARMFVQGSATQMTEFLQWKQNGGQMSDNAKAFNDMSATDKLALLSTANVVNGALGKDITGFQSITDALSKVIDGLSNEDIVKEKDKAIKEKEARLKEVNEEISRLTSGSDNTVYSTSNQQKVSNLMAERSKLQNDLKDGNIESAIMEERLGEMILSDKDKELMKYLHKDNKGNVYYDSTLESEQAISIKDLATWQVQGEKRVNYSKAKTLLEQKNGVILGDLGFDEAITKAKKMYDDVKLQFNENSLQAVSAINNVSNTYLQDKLSSFYQNNDLAGMNNFLNDVRAGRVTDDAGNIISTAGSEDAIKKLSAALEKLQDSADVQEIMNLITNLQDLKDSLADVATSARMSFSGLDEGSKYGVNQSIAEDIKTLFRDLADNEDRKTEGEKNETYRELLNALDGMKPENIKEAILQGLESGDGIKIKDKLFSLDSDTLMELGSIISENMDEAIKDAFASDTKYGDGEGGIDNLVSGREKEIASAMGISIDELKEELAKLTDLNSELATRQDTQTQEYKTLEEERNRTVEEIFQGYSDSMKDYKESADTAINNFSDAIAKYDSEIAKAISVLEDRVERKGFLSQSVLNMVTNFFSGGSNDSSSSSRSGGTTRP